MPKTSKHKNGFEKISEKISEIVGSPAWFAFSLIIVLIWLPSGFLFGFNELWHLFINTFTTILTFLMMALLHSSQSKWEREIEQLQVRQDRTLKILEKDTEEIKTNLGHQQEDQSEDNKSNKENRKKESGYEITSLF